jgi:hypothetical protein
MNILKDVDFIEIGTSDFDSLAQTCADNEVGISIEPLKYYLDRLPTKTNVTKINCAISFNNTEGDITIYYVPSEVIEENKLPQMLKGCNSISGYHYWHRKLEIEHLVQKQTVHQIPIAKVLAENNVGKIKYLKIDTEGGDCFILEHLFEYLKDKPKDFYPKKIKFESNAHTEKAQIHKTIELYKTAGYVVHYQDVEDTILILQ